MKLRRVSWVAVLGTLLGCHEDPPVVLQFAPPLVTGINLLAPGGPASTGGVIASQGGSGGAISIFTRNDLRLGAADVTPEPATAPVFPTTGRILATADFGAHRDIDVPTGNIQITSLVTTDVAGPPGTPRRIIADTGDIVILSTLQSGSVTGLDPSGLPLHAMADLELDAPQGTIYLSGVIQTASVDGIADGTSGGALTLVAQHVVLLGEINTSGASSVGPKGGAGGAVTVTVPPTGGGFLFRNGILNTFGGLGMVQGGKAGDITLNIQGGALDLFGTITASGGISDGSLGPVQGGAGGAISLVASGTVTINSSMNCRGGDASTSGGVAGGGSGGSFLLQNLSPAAPVAVRFYGTLDLSGGSALSESTGPGPTTGGPGGVAQIGQGASPVLSLLSGSSTLDSSGGPGDLGGAGAGISLSALGTGTADLIVSGSLFTVGGPGGVGPGGPGSPILLSTASSGNLTLSGLIQSDGGSSLVDHGGDAGPISITGTATSAITLSTSARVTATAGAGGSSGGAGAAGTILMTLTNGTVTLGGSLETLGGTAPVQFTSLGSAGPSAGGQITIQTGASGSGSITAQGSLLVSGGSSSADAGISVAGGPGGSVLLATLSPTGQIQIGSGGIIQADGGASTGSRDGGFGGSIRFTTSGPSISISGFLTALGGPAGGTGGLGGTFSATTDVANVAGVQLGDVTVLPETLIDVSGGPGFHGGNAQGDGRRFSVSLPVAIVLQAEAVPGKPNTGSVVNLGVLRAEGGSPSGSGGDVLFLGSGAAGAGAPQPGALELSGSGAGVTGDFAGTP